MNLKLTDGSPSCRSFSFVRHAYPVCWTAVSEGKMRSNLTLCRVREGNYELAASLKLYDFVDGIDILDRSWPR